MNENKNLLSSSRNEFSLMQKVDAGLRRFLNLPVLFGAGMNRACSFC